MTDTDCQAKKISKILRDLGGVFTELHTSRCILKNVLVGKLVGSSIIAMTRQERPDGGVELTTHFLKPDEVLRVKLELDKKNALVAFEGENNDDDDE